MDFLSQIPMALLGRPTTGVLDFAGGAIGGLATGDSGSLRPGILSSLGRLGMMAMAVKQSKDPMAVLKVKSYFDAQDAQKNNAMADPMAAQMTPAEFEKVHGFVPPSKSQLITNPGMTPSYTGGTVKFEDRVDTAPPDPIAQFKMNSAKARNDAAAATADSFEQRQIYDNGTSARENTQHAAGLMAEYMQNNPNIDPREFYVGYKTGADGSIMPDIQKRDQTLLTRDDLEGFAQENNLDANGLAKVASPGGFDSEGNPLYKVSVFNKPRQGGGGGGRTPIIDQIYQYHIANGESPDDAARAAFGARFQSKPGKKEKTTLADDLAAADGVEFTPEEKIAINQNAKGYMVPVKASEQAFVNDKTETPTKMIDKIREGARNRRGEQDQYTTQLSPIQEQEFQRWKAVYAPKDSGKDYDLRGAFKEGLEPGKDGHWSDKYKKPNHPTFSDQSIYAKDAPEKAGHWDGDKYIKPGKTEIPEEKAADAPKVPRPQETPQGSNVQPASQRMDPDTKPTPQPKAVRISAEKVRGTEKNTAMDFDKRVKSSGYSLGHVQELAKMVQNTGLNIAEQGKYLEDVISDSKQLTAGQKKEALRAIPQLLGVK